MKNKILAALKNAKCVSVHHGTVSGYYTQTKEIEGGFRILIADESYSIEVFFNDIEKMEESDEKGIVLKITDEHFIRIQ